MSATDFVNVVFASDENFLAVTSVALTSVAVNFRDNRKLRAFLLTDKDMPDDDLARFEGLAEEYNFDFERVIVSAESLASVRTTRGISIATYFRLYMHLVLPDDVEKVVYLDSDMVIVDNIAELFDTAMGDKLFAAAEDYNSVAHRTSYGTPPDSVNINAGMLVCNIAAMRTFDFSAAVEDYVDKNRFRIFHGDQQILNALFYDRMMYVPIRWNMHGQLFEPNWVKSNMKGRAHLSLQSIAEGAINPAIIHYNGALKPWNGGNHPKRMEWFLYAKKSSYSDRYQQPAVKAPSGKRPPTLWETTKRKLWLDKLQRALIEGYKARDTRIRMDRMFSKGQIWKEKPFDDVRVLSEKASILQMHQYLWQRGVDARNREFSATTYLKALKEDTRIFANAPGLDLEGGFHENVKLLFRSSHISSKIPQYESEIALILHMAVRTQGFWNALLYSSYDRDLIFGEAAFFGAYAGYFDRDAPSITRRPFGYILDDVCYYYDSRQPSRLEMKLNDPTYQLPVSDVERCKKLIARVSKERLTKYNRYAGRGTPVHLEPNAVVVVDQTPHDASVKYGGAESKTIADMAEAAMRENPGAPVYFKRHPDNVTKNRSTIRPSTRIKILPDDADITSVLDQCAKVYVVASQVGFEALLRRKTVVTFGMPFYAGWGLTEDRQRFQRRTQKRSVEDLFYAACIDMSAYVNPITSETIEIEQAFDLVQAFREMDPPQQAISVEECNRKDDASALLMHDPASELAG